MTKFLFSALHTTSNVHNVNPKANQKGCWERNNYAISKKCSIKANVDPFLVTIQKGNAQCHHYTVRNSHANLKWAWNENEPKLLALITFNKIGQEYTKNLEAMKGGTKAQLPR
jgi:hypothetical protein